MALLVRCVWHNFSIWLEGVCEWDVTIRSRKDDAELQGVAHKFCSTGQVSGLRRVVICLFTGLRRVRQG